MEIRLTTSGVTEAQQQLGALNDSLQVVVQAANTNTGALENLSQGHKRTGDAAKEHGVSVRELSGVSKELTGVLQAQGVPVDTLREGFGHLSTVVRSLGVDSISTGAAVGLLGASVATLAVGAAVESAKSFIEMADSIRELKERTDLSIPTIQGLQGAMGAVGMGAGDADRSLTLFSRNVTTMVDQMAAGQEPTGKFVESIGKLHISFEDFVNANPDQRLRMVMDGFQGLTNESDKASISLALFGRGGAGMISVLDQGSGSIDKWAQKTRDAGAAMDEAGIAKALAFHNQMEELTLSVQGFEHEIGGPVLGFVTDFAQGVTTAAQQVHSLTAELTLGNGSLGGWKDSLLAALPGVGLLVAGLDKLGVGHQGAAQAATQGKGAMDSFTITVNDEAGSAINLAGTLTPLADQHRIVMHAAQEATPAFVAAGHAMAQERQDAKDLAAELANTDFARSPLAAGLTDALVRLHDQLPELRNDAISAADEVTRLSDAFTKARDNGDWSAMLTAFQGELGNSDIKVKQLHDDWAGMLHVPSQEELDLKAKISDVTLTIDQLHAALSNSTPALQHVASLQHIYDQAVLTGAKLSDQTKAKEDLDRALSQTGAAGADAAAMQIRLDKLEPTRKGLQDQLTPLVDAKNAAQDHANAVAAGNPHFDHQLAVLPPLATAIGSTVQPGKDAAGAGEALATAYDHAYSKANTLLGLMPTIQSTLDLLGKVASGATSVANAAGVQTSLPGGRAGGILSPVAQIPGAAVTQKFGEAGEQGVDFGIPVGSPLISGGAGVVTAVTNQGQAGIGLSVTIKLDDGTLETIGHLSKVMVDEGQKIAAGVTVGLSGGAVGSPTSGVTSGPHTEIQIRTPSGQLIDPLTVLGTGAGTAAAIPAPTGGTLSAIQIAQGLLAAGMPAANVANSVAIILAESGGSVNAGSGAGAAGFAQLMPGFAGISEADRTGTSPAALAAQFKAFVAGSSGGTNLMPWDPYSYVGGGNPAVNYGEVFVGAGKGSFTQFLGQGQAAAAATAGQAFTPGGVNPQPAPETPGTPVSIDAAAENARKALVALGTEWNDVQKGIVNGVQTVTDAQLGAAQTQAESDRAAAQTAISEAGRANQQVLDDIQNNVEPATLKADQDIARSATDAANEKTAAWRKSAGEYNSDLTANLQQTQAANAAIVQSSIDAAAGQRAITKEATEFFRVNDLDTMHGHEAITEQTAVHDQGLFDAAKQRALGGIADQITAQQRYNSDLLALDDARARHLVGNDLQVFQSAVDTDGRILAAATQTSSDLVADADKRAQQLIAANQSVEKDFEQGLNRRISVANQLYDINLKQQDPNLSPSQRTALSAEATQLPGLEDKLGQLQDALPRLRELEALAPAGSSLQQQYLDAIRQNIEAQNLATRAITALGTAANDTGKTMSDADAAIINAGLAQVGGGHIMLASEVPSPAVSRFWDVYGAAIAGGASPAEATAAARSGASPTSSSAIAGAAVAAANPALDAAIAASKPLVDAVTAAVPPNTIAQDNNTTATNKNTDALNTLNSTVAQGGAGTGGPFSAGGPGALQGGAGTGGPFALDLGVSGSNVAVPMNPTIANELGTAMGTAVTPAVSAALSPVPAVAGQAVGQALAPVPAAVGATVTTALAPIVTGTAAANQQTILGALTTAQGGHFLITSAGLVEDSAQHFDGSSAHLDTAIGNFNTAISKLPTGAGGAPAGVGVTAAGFQGSAQEQGQFEARLLGMIATHNLEVTGLYAVEAAREQGLKSREEQAAAYLAQIAANTHDTTARLSVVTARTGQEAFFDQGAAGFGPTGFTAPAPATTPTNPQLAAIVQNTDQTAAAVQQTAAAVQENTAAINQLANQQAETKLYIDSYLIGSASARAIQRKLSLNLRPIVRAR